MDLGELLEVVLEELDLLLLGRAGEEFLFCLRTARRLLDLLSEVLHEDLPQVVQGLQLLQHRLFQTLK